jgi:formylmethanofuran dehydrogenase subunit E
MDERPDPPADPQEETIKCGMCQQQVPAHQVRVMSGRPLCLGCLSAWYGEEDDE